MNPLINVLSNVEARKPTFALATAAFTETELARHARLRFEPTAAAPLTRVATLSLARLRRGRIALRLCDDVRVTFALSVAAARVTMMPLLSWIGRRCGLGRSRT